MTAATTPTPPTPTHAEVRIFALCDALLDACDHHLLGRHEGAAARSLAAGVTALRYICNDLRSTLAARHEEHRADLDAAADAVARHADELDIAVARSMEGEADA